MAKLLYVTANSKPESLSASKQVGRKLVDEILQQQPNLTVETLDLYEGHVPRLKYEYFEGRNSILNENARLSLSKDQQKEVDHIVSLCDQFIASDIVVMAVPMWSLSFPAPFKEYIDCIIQVGKTISFEGDTLHGLLDDKVRTVFYVQSSGAPINLFNTLVLNKGYHYVRDLMKIMGIKTIEPLFVDQTGTTLEQKEVAITTAVEKIPDLVKSKLKVEC